MPRRVAISQSNYIPWRGYFDMIDQVDEFLLLDEVQYTRRDWRNRNKIRTPDGTRWLSVPVQAKGRYHQRIDETVISEPGWAASHWASIQHEYRTAPYFDHHGARLEEAYRTAGDLERLSDVNRLFIELVCDELGIETMVRWSTDYASADGATERLVALCVAAGADEYLSGPAARAYLDEEAFARHGIEVRWMDYSRYAPYEQQHPGFEPAVTVLDLMLNTGPEARRLFRPVL